MTITTLDQLIAGLQAPVEFYKDTGTAEAAGVMHSLWYTTGALGAGSAPTGGLNGATFSGTVAGQLPIPAAVVSTRVYLERLEAAQAANIGSIAIIDRLWGNVPVVTTTTGQSVTSPTWPSRDSAGATLGAGVRLALEVSSTTGNGSPITNTTVTYTNSSGTASRTATCASFPATGLTGTFVPLSLQAGDVGVRSVQTITLGTSYVSGAVHLVAYRFITRVGLPAANTTFDRDFAQLGMPTIWDSSVLGLVAMPTSTALGIVTGSAVFAQG